MHKYTQKHHSQWRKAMSFSLTAWANGLKPITLKSQGYGFESHIDTFLLQATNFIFEKLLKRPLRGRQTARQREA